MSRPHELRIIAGRWRGRRWRFPADTTIRPTPDRVRETLFNWLAPYLTGARVLDLFAGSGALGLEALSRGAASADFVDSDPRCIEALRERLREWQGGAEPLAVQTQCFRADATSWLRTPRAPYDIVFVDPPFAAGLWASICKALEHGAWLAPQAFIYLETPSVRESTGASADSAVLVEVPPSWRLWRSGKAGEVGYHLYRREAAEAATKRPDHEA